jgi:sugar phosphate isomerase/epimerase
MADNDPWTASPCCNPGMTLPEALAAYSRLGFRKFEAFTSWANSALDWERDPAFYRELGSQQGMQFVSLHLPPVGDDRRESLAQAVKAARFAALLGARVVLFKATSRASYLAAAKPFLDATEELGITPVLQNHAGSPISTLADFQEALDGIGDPRMKTLLEVGHFHAVGVSWRQGYDLLRDSIALIHIKDQVGRQSVPFGTGEVDLPGLFRWMRSVGYTGDYVVEMEVEDRENTLRYLQEALAYVRAHYQEAA